MNKEKFSSLALKIFNYDFNVYKVINDNNIWYEIIAIKDNKEYYVCKLDYSNTNKGIKSFLLKDLVKRLKQKHTNLNFKVLSSGIKVNDKIFRLKNSFYYSLQYQLLDYIDGLEKQNMLIR